MSSENNALKQKAMNEIALGLAFVLGGLVLLPVAIYLTGESVFGEYGGAGFGDFYRQLSSDVRDGRPVVLFLVLSPYLIFMLLRVTIWAFVRSWRAGKGRNPA